MFFVSLLTHNIYSISSMVSSRSMVILFRMRYILILAIGTSFTVDSYTSNIINFVYFFFGVKCPMCKNGGVIPFIKRFFGARKTFTAITGSLGSSSLKKIVLIFTLVFELESTQNLLTCVNTYRHFDKTINFPKNIIF